MAKTTDYIWPVMHVDVHTSMEREKRLRKRREQYHARKNRETAEEGESQLEEEHVRCQHAMKSTEQVALCQLLHLEQ